MKVVLLVHMERLEDGGAVFWGETSEIPGFTVAADTLTELQTQARFALIEVLDDDGDVLEELDVRLVPLQPQSSNPTVGQVVVGEAVDEPRTDAGEGRVAVLS